MPDAFISFCESLWRSWLDDTLVASTFLQRKFDLEAAPEPYLLFEPGTRPLVVLTTNPGKTLAFQRRHAVLDDGGPVNAAMDYATAAKALGRRYGEILRGQPAGRRIAAFRELAQLAGTDGVMQVEVCPFHSPSLRNKDSLTGPFETDPLLAPYIAHLRVFVRALPAVVISAAPSQASLGPDTVLSSWVAWQAELLAIDLGAATFIPLVRKAEKVTCAAFISGNAGSPKALVLMMGSNQLPGEEGLGILGSALRRFIHAG